MALASRLAERLTDKRVDAPDGGRRQKARV
jgi:hypothetical protein